jgi:hypothetical protein
MVFWGWPQYGLSELSSVLPFVLRGSLAGCSFLHFGSADGLKSTLFCPAAARTVLLYYFFRQPRSIS